MILCRSTPVRWVRFGTHVREPRLESRPLRGRESGQRGLPPPLQHIKDLTAHFRSDMVVGAGDAFHLVPQPAPPHDLGDAVLDESGGVGVASFVEGEPGQDRRLVVGRCGNVRVDAVPDGPPVALPEPVLAFRGLVRRRCAVAGSGRWFVPEVWMAVNAPMISQVEKMIGDSNGRVMCRNRDHLPTPSIAAAS
jgi:hypothetical protein